MDNVISPAVLSPVASRFAAYPTGYERVLLNIEHALSTREQGTIADAFAALGEFRPVHAKLPASASKEEKRDARDDYISAKKLHQRVLRDAFNLARDAGATVTEAFAGSVSTTGNVSVRQTTTAKLTAPKRATVRL